MKPIIDIHSHILPGVDDGCQSGEEALRMLKMYEEQNVEAVICTPHFGSCSRPGANVKEAFNRLKRQESTVKLYLGNEVLFEYLDHPGWRSLNETGWLLLEFEDWEFHTPAEVILGECKMLGKRNKVILAHPERYKDIREKPEICKEIVNSGVKLQINAYDIHENKNTAELSQWLLKNQLVSFLGSDAHGASRRPPNLLSGVRWIYDNCPDDYADAVVHDNAAKMIMANMIRKGYERLSV